MRSRIPRTIRIGIVVVGVLAVAAGVLGAQEADPVNTTDEGVAIKGYDPVAYFTMSKAYKGKPEITYEWRGATWRFVNEEHRAMFAENPEKYAPEYGGYCAWAVSRGSTADIDPQAWVIHDDRLFLNLNGFIGMLFRLGIKGNVAKADEKWPEVQETAGD